MTTSRSIFSSHPPLWAGLLLALALAAAAALSRQMIGPLVANEMPHLPFVAAVLLAAVWGGWSAGVAATLASALLANWVFLGDYGRFDFGSENLWASGFFVGVGLVITAIAERLSRAMAREAELNRQLEIVNGELRHRISNVIAVVQALARHAAREAATVEAYEAALSARLEALGAAQRLLSRGEGEDVPLGSLLTELLRPFDDGRIEAEGAMDEVRVPAAATVPLALAVHELATNAAKHGALSAPAGRVRLRSVREGSSLQLSWEERGGPPVAAPAARGSGMRLLERAFPDGRLSIAYPPEGLRCRMQLPAA